MQRQIWHTHRRRWLQAKEWQQPPKAGRGRARIRPGSRGGRVALRHLPFGPVRLTLGFLPPELGENEFVVFNHQACNLSQHPQDTDADFYPVHTSPLSYLSVSQWAIIQSSGRKHCANLPTHIRMHPWWALRVIFTRQASSRITMRIKWVNNYKAPKLVRGTANSLCKYLLNRNK